MQKNDVFQLKQKKIPLLAVVGPTAVGKTALAVKLAQRLDGEIVSADSVQVYRYLNIGTAKPSPAEQEGIAHHLIDIVDPSVNFTVYDYQRMARDCISEINKRDKLPILSGGTGLYFKAVVDQYVFSSGKSNPEIRKRLKEEYHSRGKDYLYQLLKKCDPVAAQKIHPNDQRRMIRALEFFYLTGEPISSQQELTIKKNSPYNLVVIGLTMKRNYLYQRINDRIEQMLKKGLLEEVKSLLQKGYHGGLKSMQSLGYKHIIQYLKGEWDFETTITLFKRDTRRYAKRQLTWFQADKRVKWLEVDPFMDINSILNNICLKIEGY
ncbi:MAG: tRNA (adenosine(37)-N6)-dimethylallyltransferase MiaA [Dethiobacteria bacterium]|jgi:tRNA dimethylallyltransferase